MAATVADLVPLRTFVINGLLALVPPLILSMILPAVVLLVEEGSRGEKLGPQRRWQGSVHGCG